MKKKAVILILAVVVAVQSVNIAADIKVHAQPTEATKEVTFQPLPEAMNIEMQEQVFKICKEEGVSFPMVMAIIRKESEFNKDAIGEKGDSGLMQVVPQWHTERMKELGITDIMEPLQNIRVGVNYLAECLRNHPGNAADALMAYNMGEKRASELIKQGVCESEYAADIEEIMNGYNEWMVNYEEE